ncbi:3-dehydroquinate synthase [Roseibacillus ishigakijimensis]|uniref:3-dehydroquinate synthase n=1 Tax=Roseibacillus ishigakijimensis TaxID=454146 RepID=A0A934RR78_9BACT|nr:3-dehydroquinate synthase [Roseibacillus ishigakijimensis]MBK1835433.1 3-dehydroquinate synthase [Roseibacillus ishigakijimensis]
MPVETVSLTHTRYEILVESGALQRLGQHCKIAGLSGKAALISDDTVGPLYLETARLSLQDAGFETSTHLFPAGEGSKSMAQADQLSRSLIQAGHDRSSFIIALGGGVTGDLAGFVAAIYYRGIPVVQVPTTIVSQVDSSVGGKTGVNTPEGKNLLGAFHQPHFVLIDPATLTSLPPREYREGFAEVIKHAAIRDADMLDELAALDPEDAPPPAELLLRNLAIKAHVVEEDEKETAGTRALLNFGHTIGHAIEAAVPYGELLHGEAISLGIRAALFLSEKHSTLTRADSEKILALLERFSLPLTLPADLSTDLLIEKMGRDKKFSGGQRTFVLLSRAGEAHTSREVTTESVVAAIEELRQPCPALV